MTARLFREIIEQRGLAHVRSFKGLLELKPEATEAFISMLLEKEDYEMLTEIKKDLDSKFIIYVIPGQAPEMLSPDFLMLENAQQYEEAVWSLVLCQKFGIPKEEIQEMITACS